MKNEILCIVVLFLIVFGLTVLENLNTMNDSQAPTIFGIDVSEQEDRTVMVFNTNKPYEIGGRYRTVSGAVVEVVACSGPGKNGVFQVAAQYLLRLRTASQKNGMSLKKFTADLLLSKHEGD